MHSLRIHSRVLDGSATAFNYQVASASQFFLVVRASEQHQLGGHLLNSSAGEIVEEKVATCRL